MVDSELIISTPKEPFTQIKDFLANATREIILFAPYIKADVLNQVLPNKKLYISIITSWKVSDILFGSSDLNLYQMAKEKSCSLFINNRIHLKAFVCDWKSFISGSANLTNNGLGISTNYNYELNYVASSIDIKTQIYLKTILSEATLVTHNIYSQMMNAIKRQPPIPKIEELDFQTSKSHTDEFLISSLPMSKNIDALFTIYANDFDELSNEELFECAIHDVILYHIPYGLNKERFIDHLKEVFFKSNFIQNLLNFIGNDGKYFGQVKEWIQKNCHDVPVPSRRDLTGNIQVLFRWIVELSEGRYLADRPNYSQRIYRATMGQERNV